MSKSVSMMIAQTALSEQQKVRISAIVGKNKSTTWHASHLELLAKTAILGLPIDIVLKVMSTIRPGTARGAITTRCSILRRERIIQAPAMNAKRRTRVIVKDLFPEIKEQIKPANLVCEPLGGIDDSFSLLPSKLVKFEDLSSNGCRWPFGEVSEGGLRFCCLTKVPGVSYCQSHLRNSRSEV